MGALGHGPVHYSYAVLSDVTQWTRDRALRRYFDCAAAHVGLCNIRWPTRCPAARQLNRRTPPCTTACARQASGNDPQASKGPPRETAQASTPHRPPIRRREAAIRRPIGCGEPPPKLRESAAARGPQQLVSERSRSREPKQDAAARVTREARGKQRPHCAAPRSPYTAAAAAISPTRGGESPRRSAASEPAPQGDRSNGADSKPRARESRREPSGGATRGETSDPGGSQSQEPRQALNAPAEHTRSSQHQPPPVH